MKDQKTCEEEAIKNIIKLTILNFYSYPLTVETVMCNLVRLKIPPCINMEDAFNFVRDGFVYEDDMDYSFYNDHPYDPNKDYDNPEDTFVDGISFLWYKFKVEEYIKRSSATTLPDLLKEVTN